MSTETLAIQVNPEGKVNHDAKNPKIAEAMTKLSEQTWVKQAELYAKLQAFIDNLNKPANGGNPISTPWKRAEVTRMMTELDNLLKGQNSRLAEKLGISSLADAAARQEALKNSVAAATPEATPSTPKISANVPGITRTDTSITGMASWGFKETLASRNKLMADAGK